MSHIVCFGEVLLRLSPPSSMRFAQADGFDAEDTLPLARPTAKPKLRINTKYAKPTADTSSGTSPDGGERGAAEDRL